MFENWKLTKKLNRTFILDLIKFNKIKKEVKERKIVDENRLNSLICNCNIEFKKKIININYIFDLHKTTTAKYSRYPYLKLKLFKKKLHTTVLSVRKIVFCTYVYIHINRSICAFSCVYSIMIVFRFFLSLNACSLP